MRGLRSVRRVDRPKGTGKPQHVARDESWRLPYEWVKGVDPWHLVMVDTKEGEWEQEILRMLLTSGIGDKIPSTLRYYRANIFMFTLVLSWGQA